MLSWVRGEGVTDGDPMKHHDIVDMFETVDPCGVDAIVGLRKNWMDAVDFDSGVVEIKLDGGARRSRT